MEYSAFNLTIWLIFLVFIAAAYVIVKAYHKIYPNYPFKDKQPDFFKENASLYFSLRDPSFGNPKSISNVISRNQPGKQSASQSTGLSDAKRRQTHE